MKNQFTIEWKARDFKNSHAWISDKVSSEEAPACDPTRMLPYINPARFVNIGKKCKKCLKAIESIKTQFPKIQIMYT